MLCSWLAKYAPLSQPLRNKTKTYRDLLAYVFLRLSWRLHEFDPNSDWFNALFTSAVIVQSNYFGFDPLRHSNDNWCILCKGTI